VDINKALNKLSHDVDVDARVVVLIDLVEFRLGGAEGLGYSDSDRGDLRMAIFRLLAVRWAQRHQEEDDRLGVATDHRTTRTTMPSDAPLHPPRSPEERRRGFYVVSKLP
jgi:hypothetical protein